MNERSVLEAGRRGDILDAALTAFAERGFHGARVPEIAKEAGVAAGTIYRHFASKEQLVNEVFRVWKSTLNAAVLEEFPFDAEPRAQFREFFARLAGFAKAYPLAFDFLELHHHAPYLDEANLMLELSTLIPVAHFFEQSREEGVTKQGPPEVLIAFVWGALVGVVKASRLGHYSLSEEVLALTEACCWDAVRK